MKDKRGLSAIVATLIIILLTLVAVGIIWVVIRNVVQSGANQVDISSKCLAVSLEAVGVVNTSNTVYSVTLKRNAGGEDLGGVKITIQNNTDSSAVLDFGNIVALQTKTTTGLAGVVNANKIEFTPFFLDSSGNQLLCPQSSQTFSF